MFFNKGFVNTWGIQASRSKAPIQKCIVCFKLRAELFETEYILACRSLSEVYGQNEDTYNARYHCGCYQKATNKEHIARAVNRSNKNTHDHDGSDALFQSSTKSMRTKNVNLFFSSFQIRINSIPT